MKKDYGIIKEYNGLTGIITSGNEQILFLKNDIIGDINVNDEVFFRKEINSEKVLRAYFVQKSLNEEKGSSRKMVKNNDR